ncbi:unnamed protein product [Ranitomeya imitator]|uniref:Helix-turn-helix domain-containing protein n=1 Tax=Ranitomeya imitator TaxID=111125 RepID=A0ABN9ML65_9NEOB|nr:unnamed protein product [Ranitomeya imitator]
MGAACAPSFAGLFLGYWERGVLGGDGPWGADHVQCWLRYIDDLFIIWQGTEKQLQDFMQQLNVNNFNIKLTYFASKNSINFLDINVSVDQDLFLQTDVFRKPTSTNSLLHARSSHPYRTIKAIPVGQFLGMRRICSSESKFQSQANDLCTRFLERGYSKKCIKAGYNRAKSCIRDELLRPKYKSIKKEQQIRFISTYNGQWQDMRACISKHWDVLKTDATLAKSLTDVPLMNSRRSKDLGDLLMSSHYVPVIDRSGPFFNSGGPTKGCFSCGNCIACKNIARATTFQSADGKKQFNIRQHITCKTTQVIYYATCTCPKIYVGLTSRRLGMRTREHVRDIVAAESEPEVSLLKTLPRHFRLFHNCNPKHLSVRGIEHVQCGIRGGDIKRLLAQKECRWIFTLGTMVPDGLNETTGYSSFL